MPDYSGIINTIETAVYGRDMRQAIANGFRLCQSNEGGGGGGSVTVDTTLTVSGQAADSKTVGDKFTDLESQISAISPGLSRAEKDAILAYFAEQVEIHPSLEDAYQAIYNLWNKPVNSITLNKHSLMLAVGMSEKLLVTIDPPDAYDRTVTWSSRPQGIVSVAQDGTVMALQDGRATVTASCGGKTDSCSVTAVQMNYYSVTNNLTNVTNSNSASSVLEGESYSATLSVTPDYNLTDVQITMGGSNITSSAYNNESHEIYIASVSGNITITASATKIVYYSVMWQLSNASVSGGDQPSTVLGGSTFNYTIQTNSDANYEINSVQVMMGDRDITSTAVTAGGEGEKSVTITIDSVSGNIKIIVSAVVAIKVLNDCTWAEISQISSSGQAANTFSVGDQKEIVLNGSALGTRFNKKQIRVFIVGINHNAYREGNNLIHFEMFKLSEIDDGRAFTDSQYGNTTTGNTYGCYMNPNENASGGWYASYIRTNMLGGKEDVNPNSPTINTLMSVLPQDLRTVMKTARKYTYNDTYSSATNDYISMYSPFEIFGKSTYANSSETSYQEQYEYYKNGNSVIHKQALYGDTDQWVVWATRSKYYRSNTSFCVVNGAAENFRMANTSLGIVTLFFV